jgi:hypothetical protein
VHFYHCLPASLSLLAPAPLHQTSTPKDVRWIYLHHRFPKFFVLFAFRKITIQNLNAVVVRKWQRTKVVGFCMAWNIFKHFIRWFKPINISTFPTSEPNYINRYSDGLRASRPGFDCRRGKIFLFSIASRMALRPTKPPIRRVPGEISPGIKWPGREADHSPPSTANVKNDGVIPPLPHVFMVQCLIN